MQKRTYDHVGKQIHYWDSRFYTKDWRNFYPGATTVLQVWPKGKYFEDWLKSNGFNADVIARLAAEDGSATHNAIEDFETIGYIRAVKEDDEGDTVGKYSQRVWDMVRRYMDFKDLVKPEILAVEQIIVSDKYRLGGALDLICRIDGEKWLIDHKTSKSLHSTNDFQQAAYVKIYNEAFPQDPIKRAGLLWLNAHTKGRRKGKWQGKGWQIKEVEDLEKGWEMFCHARAIFDYENPNYKPANYTMPIEFRNKDFDND